MFLFRMSQHFKHCTHPNMFMEKISTNVPDFSETDCFFSFLHTESIWSQDFVNL